MYSRKFDSSQQFDSRQIVALSPQTLLRTQGNDFMSCLYQ